MEWENQFFEDTSFFWYNSVNGVPCRYKGVNGVFFVGIKALTAFNRKNSGVNGVFFVGIKALTAFYLSV